MVRTILRAALCAVLALTAVGAGLLPQPSARADVVPVTVGYQSSNLIAGMADLVRAVPCDGGRLDLVLYSNNLPALNDLVIEKARCGVVVRLVTSIQKPDGKIELPGPTPEMRRLAEGVGQLGGTVKIGRGALTANGSKYLEHEKIVAADLGGPGQRYVVSDSGNWTASTDRALNDRMTVRDDCLYAATIKHIDVLQRDRHVSREKPARSCDRQRILYWMPTTRADPDLGWARKARCGKGDRVVWSPFYLTSGSRAKYGSGRKLVDQLIRFKRAGADVQVAANDFKWSTSQRQRLIAAKIPVYDLDERLGLDPGYYLHRKTLAAVGCSGRPYGSQGSASRTSTALMRNGNQILVTRLAVDVQAMVVGFDASTQGRPLYTS